MNRKIKLYQVILLPLLGIVFQFVINNLFLILSVSNINILFPAIMLMYVSERVKTSTVNHVNEFYIVSMISGFIYGILTSYTLLYVLGFGVVYYIYSKYIYNQSLALKKFLVLFAYFFTINYTEMIISLLFVPNYTVSGSDIFLGGATISVILNTVIAFLVIYLFNRNRRKTNVSLL